LDERIAVVERTLQEIGASGKPTILVLNKADQLPPDWDRQQFQRRYPDALLVSALTGEGLDELKERIYAEYARQRLVRLHAQLTLQAQEVVAFAFRHGTVRRLEYHETAIVLEAELERHLAERVQKQVAERGWGTVTITPVQG
jgi:GTP-binding protein HflX